MIFRKKGFTLVELMIVIVIIGILAAIIIPTVTNAIDKANFASDQSDAKNMNTVLNIYCVENNIDPSQLEAPEVRAIVSSGEKNYNFVPKSSNSVFWYNQASATITVVKTSDFSVSSLFSAYADDLCSNPNSPEELREGYLYLNTTGDLAKTLVALRNVSNLREYETLQKDVEGIDLSTFIESFHPKTTLYISATGMYKGPASTDEKVNRIVYAPNLSIIPSSIQPLSFDDDVEIRIPTTVKVVENGAFATVLSQTKVVVSNPTTKVVEGALSSSIKEISNVENITSEEFKNNIKGNELVKIEITKENPQQETYTAESSNGSKARIDLINEGELSVGEIKINTVELMKAFPNINAVDISYLPKKDNTVDIYIRAFDDSGLVVDMIVSYIAKAA